MSQLEACTCEIKEIADAKLGKCKIKRKARAEEGSQSGESEKLLTQPSAFVIVDLRQGIIWRTYDFSNMQTTSIF